MTLSIALLSFNYLILSPQFKTVMQESAHKDIVATINRLQGSIEYLFEKEDMSGIKREVLANASHEEVKYLILLDEKLNVIASSKESYVGKNFSTLALHISSDVINQVLLKKTRQVYESQDEENTLYGVVPFSILGEKGVRDTRWGLIVLEVDMGVREFSILSKIDGLFWLASFFIFSIGVLFWLSFQKTFNQRLATIISAAKKIAEGEFQTRLEFSGKNELSDIAHAMDFMAGKIEADHQEIISRHMQLDSILRNIPSMVYIKNLDGKYLMVNQRFSDVFPQLDLACGETVYSILSHDEADKFTRYDTQVLDTGKPISKRVTFTVDGKELQFFMVKFPLFDTTKCPYAICTIATDLSEQEQAENLLNISKSIFENTVESIVIMDNKRKIIDVNKSFEKVTQYSKEESFGKEFRFYGAAEINSITSKKIWKSLFDNGHWMGELSSLKKSGEGFFERVSINSIVNRENEITGYIGISQDISKEKESSDTLLRLAFRDALTGLHNRESFQKKLESISDRAQRDSVPFGVLFIDLDFFKEVNDSQGHGFGDKILVLVAERLLRSTRVVDVVSRLGGDEFTVLVTGLASGTNLAALASKIIKELSAPYHIDAQEVIIGCSIGIAIFPQDGDDVGLLLKHADAAMYHAKELGRGCYSFFDFSINEKNQRLIKIKQALRCAIENSEYRIVYQPKVNPHKGVITGYEALLRWNSQLLGDVSPAEFIPIAEESVEIDRITNWVIKSVANHKQQSKILGAANVAINISAKQFKSDNWVNTLRTMNDNGQLDVRLITIEVTETALIDSFEVTLDQLNTVRDLGAMIAIDDFGTGYSSLSYLKRMPIDYVKIDRSFVQDIGIDLDDQTIVQTVISMSHALDLKVIAEGAESGEQVAFLRSKGCDEIQGYYYAKPLELVDVDSFVLAE
jgi:diguanylate cyclase (GGDEF)-like protein/PAS domain S-box-containing protein